MSNTNTNLQTQTSNALRNAIMEAGGKDRPPMLAPGSSETTTEGYLENYKNVSQDIWDQLNAEAKAVKDAAYHKEKMLLCKQEKARIQLSAEQTDWRYDTDDEPDDQELEAHYLYMSQIQEVTPDAAHNSGPIFNAESLQKV
ncbi:hypothetical protein Tco_1245904 [Tanacetum coccineum]